MNKQAKEENEGNEAISDIEILITNYLNYRKNKNVSSNLSKTSYLVGLNDQYCSRLPEESQNVDNLSFGHLGAIDRINQETRNLVKRIFKVAECEVRLLSGVNGLTTLLFSLLEYGETLFKMDDSCGGHLSVKPIAERLGIKIVEMKYNEKYLFDLNKFKLDFFQYKPKVILLDSSYMLFQYPVKEIKEIVGSESIIIYDASHVISYIASEKFQDPLAEGADIIHCTTHKIMFGPQKSLFLFKEKNELSERIMNIVKNVLVSNTHLHHILALYIALREFEVYGDEYTTQLLENNKYFAECLEKKGFDVLAKEQGYTESNQIWVRFENKYESIQAFEKLEKYEISTNIIFLPEEQWGLRLGTNEITRLGADKDFILELTGLISAIIYKNKSDAYIYNEKKRLIEKLERDCTRYSFDNYGQCKLLIEKICMDSTGLPHMLEQ